MRVRPLWGVSVLAALAALGAGLLLAPASVERRVEDLIRRKGAARGLAVHAVHFSMWGPLRLEGVSITRPGGAVTADAVELEWRLAGGGLVHRHLAGVRLHGARLIQGRLEVEWPQAAFDVLALDPQGRSARLRQRGAGAEVSLSWTAGPGARALDVSASGLDLEGARVLWAGAPVLDPGRWTGRLHVAAAAAQVDSEGALSGERVRLALPRALGLGEGGFGSAGAVSLEWDLKQGADVLQVRRAALRMAGLDVSLRGRMGPAAELDLDVWARSELGAAFAAAAVPLPPPLAGHAGPLGTASFDVSLHGPLSNPARLRVRPRLTFEPAEEATAALQFLRGPFLHRPLDAPGSVVDVRAGAPGFVALSEVPPLFLRALLISEDAGFYGHPGLDVAEVRMAWAANVERGTAARGASTITQQLAKNLFLSQEKTYGRKLTEAALALVLDSALPKTRLLEIYLNVIEWGPGIYGLGPAARHYFGKAPWQLTPAETAFLVCLIPSPVRYHQAHAAGRVGPGMAQLMANLLSKLAAAQALSEDEYGRALAEQLAFAPEA
jgi:hypothetical protein